MMKLLFKYTTIFCFTILYLQIVLCAPPFKLVIDCSSAKLSSSLRSAEDALPGETGATTLGSTAEINSICACLKRVLPKGVKDPKFIIREASDDQDGEGNVLAPVAVKPPRNFRPLLGNAQRTVTPPKLPKPPQRLSEAAELTSAERMENLNKGLKKMMGFVNVLGQLDKYFTDRTKTVVSRLSKLYDYEDK